MARTWAELTNEELLIIEQITGLSNNTVFYKDNSGIIQEVTLGTLGQVLTSNGVDSAPSFENGGGGTSDTINEETLTGDKTLVVNTDDTIQLLNPNGARRTITLDTTGATEGDYFKIQNAGNINTTYNLYVKQGGTRIGVSVTGQTTTYTFDGTNWKNTEGDYQAINGRLNPGYIDIIDGIQYQEGEFPMLGFSSDRVASGNGGYIQLGGGTTTSAYLEGEGTGSDIDINLIPKGNGLAKINGVEIPTISSINTFINKTATGLITTANTTTIPSLKLTASSSVDISSPTAGDLWFNGTNLYFNNGSTSTDLLAGGGLSWGDSITDTSGTGITASVNGNATNTLNIVSLNTNNSNSIYSVNAIQIVSEDNSSTGYNTGIYGAVRSQADRTSTNNNRGRGSGIRLVNLNLSGNVTLFTGILGNSGTGNIGIELYGADFGIEGSHLLKGIFSNNQSGFGTGIELDLGTSAQGHTGLLIKPTGASTSQRGIHIDMSSTGTGTAIEISGSNASARVFNIDNNLTQASGTATGTTTKEIKITIDGTDYVIDAKSQA